MKNFTYSFFEPQELSALLDSSIQDTQSLLIQVFFAESEREKIEHCQNYFQDFFPLSILIGTTTDGVILGDSTYCTTQSVVVFTLFEKSVLKGVFVEHSSTLASSYESGVSVVERVLSPETKLIITFADGIHTNGEEYLKGMNSQAGDVTITGGLAADNGEITNTYVFTKEQVTNSGAVAVAIESEYLHITTDYTFDWTAIGKTMSITKSVKNRVYEIDGMSALEVYAKYLGKDIAEKLPQVGIEFPLVFQKDGLSIGRAVLFKHNDGSLTFAGNLAEGESVRFGVADMETILKNGNYKMRHLFSKMKYQPEAFFIYSCMARRRFLSEYIQDELKLFATITNSAGFFTYGEFFSSNREAHLLNETMTILSLSENSTPMQDFEDIQSIKKETKVNAQHVIAHLANKVSQELEDLNSSLEDRIQKSAAFIYKQAFFDPLTALPNRLSLIRRLDESIGKIVVLVNIDDFTSINDFYGHIIGDRILKRLATLLKEYVKKSDAEVFKLPSDEFAIVFYALLSNEELESSMKSCIDFIASSDFFVKDDYVTHISVTLASARVDGEKAGLLNADMALKFAKKTAQSLILFQDDLQLAKKYEKNIKMADMIREAIQDDKIVPYFQAIVNAKSGKIEKYEALARLQISEEKVLSPSQFLEISQKIKLYPKITEAMIEKTFAYCSQKRVKFSINLSFLDIFNTKTVEYLFNKIEKYEVASLLTIEIIETMKSEDDILVNSFIERVYAIGACIAIDDFGSGYANFEHITKIKSDFMKIDGSLIKNIQSDENARLIVETIILFAKKLGKKIVAEFVHSETIYEVVSELGVDYVQGYYFGEPKAVISP